MPRDTTDLIVLGAGSGGLATAIAAADHGARVLLLDPGPLGGTCVNAGCVPKKAMWLAADLSLAQRTATALCFDGEERELDWPRFIGHRQRYIDGIHARYRDRLAGLDVEVHASAGRLLGPGRVAMTGSDGATCERHATHVVIATGGRSRRPPIDGGGLGIDSDGFFELSAPPARITIVGGGYIAVELAGILSALGSRVRMLVRGACVLGRFDAELSDAVATHLADAGVDLRFDCEVRGAGGAPGRYRLELADGEVLDDVDELLWAVGRAPDTRSLGLDAAGIACDREGRIRVDALGNTGVAGHYAIGDVSSLGPQLTPAAVRAGRTLAGRLFAGAEPAPLLPTLVPSVVFGRPPAASIGLSEQAAREAHGEQVRVYSGSFRPMLAALAGSRQRSFVKLVCCGPEERVLGLHMAGIGADEIIQGFAVAMQMGARKRDFDATLAIHPTAAEELVLLR